MSDTASKSPPYVPHAAAASERMVGSVMNRLGGGSGGSRAWQLAGRVVDGFLNEQGAAKGDAKAGKPSQRAGERVLAMPPRLPQPAAKSERMWDAALAAPSQAAAPESRQAPPMTTLQQYEPSEVVRAGLQAREAANSTSPLWSVLPPVKLEPLLTVLENAVSRPQSAERPQEREQPRAPGMTLLQGGGAAGSTTSTSPSAATATTGRAQLQSDDRRSIPKAAFDASARLLDALRTHAAAHAAAGDSRVSLGDMTLIAHAEKKNQLAASMAQSVPSPKEPDTALGDMPNPKVFSNQHSILLKIKEIANKLMKEDEDDHKDGEARFGDA